MFTASATKLNAHLPRGHSPANESAAKEFACKLGANTKLASERVDTTPSVSFFMMCTNYAEFGKLSSNDCTSIAKIKACVR